MPRPFGWLDVETIAEELVDRFEDTDPITVNFVDLRTMVEKLPGFEPDPAHPVNERILETIQALWIEEHDDLLDDDDDDDDDDE